MELCAASVAVPHLPALSLATCLLLCAGALRLHGMRLLPVWILKHMEPMAPAHCLPHFRHGAGPRFRVLDASERLATGALARRNATESIHRQGPAGGAALLVVEAHAGSLGLALLEHGRGGRRPAPLC